MLDENRVMPVASRGRRGELDQITALLAGRVGHSEGYSAALSAIVRRLERARRFPWISRATLDRLRWETEQWCHGQDVIQAAEVCLAAVDIDSDAGGQELVERYHNVPASRSIEFKSLKRALDARVDALRNEVAAKLAQARRRDLWLASHRRELAVPSAQLERLHAAIAEFVAIEAKVAFAPGGPPHAPEVAARMAEIATQMHAQEGAGLVTALADLMRLFQKQRRMREELRGLGNEVDELACKGSGRFLDEDAAYRYVQLGRHAAKGGFVDPTELRASLSELQRGLAKFLRADTNPA